MLLLLNGVSFAPLFQNELQYIFVPSSLSPRLGPNPQPLPPLVVPSLIPLLCGPCTSKAFIKRSIQTVLNVSLPTRLYEGGTCVFSHHSIT